MEEANVAPGQAEEPPSEDDKSNETAQVSAPARKGPSTKVPPPEEASSDDVEVQTSDPGRKRPFKPMCPQAECSFTTNEMKHHMVRQHLCGREQWFLYPLLAHWECCCWEIGRHVSLHGPFCIKRHMPELVQLVNLILGQLVGFLIP